MTCEIILSFCSTVAAGASAIIAAFMLRNSVRIQKEMKQEEKKRATWDVMKYLQSEVLDKLAPLDANNAELIAEARNDNDECRQAYADYKTLIARLEHFSVGVEQGIYDFDMVYELAGEHLIFLLSKIKPVIDAANEFQDTPKYYQSFMKLVDRLIDKRNAKELSER